MILATLALSDREELEKYALYPAEKDPMLRRLRERVLITEAQNRHPRIFSTLFEEWIAETVAFVPMEKAPDLRAAIDAVKVRGFQKTWLDTTGRIRRDFAWVDVRAVVKWLLVAGGANTLLDWLHRLLQFTAR